MTNNSTNTPTVTRTVGGKTKHARKSESVYIYLSPLHLLFLGAIGEYFARMQADLKAVKHGMYMIESYSKIAANPPTYDNLFAIIQEWIAAGVPAVLPKTTKPDENGATRSAALGRQYLEALEAARLVTIGEGDRKSWKGVVTQAGAIVSRLVTDHVRLGVTHLWRNRITFSPIIALRNGGKKTAEAFSTMMFFDGIEQVNDG